MNSLIDLAGGHHSGGAARFVEQFRRFRSTDEAIGLAEHVSPSWLLRREREALQTERVISANNVSFVVAGRQRWVMARNANHFLTAKEHAQSWHTFTRRFKAQVPIVRASMLRAHVVVAPSTSMARRIATTLPEVASRIVVRFHPLDPPRRDREIGSHILCPVVPSPYKRLEQRLVALQSAIANTGLNVKVTADALSMPDQLTTDPRFHFMGVLAKDAMIDIYASAAAIYYPTDVEAFGYPLAEARASGTPVIALDNQHNREIAGSMLCGYDETRLGSLVDAVQQAVHNNFVSDPQPFDPRAYFDWMMGSANA